jgi:hypothetical protein
MTEASQQWLASFPSKHDAIQTVQENMKERKMKQKEEFLTLLEDCFQMEVGEDVDLVQAGVPST